MAVFGKRRKLENLNNLPIKLKRPDLGDFGNYTNYSVKIPPPQKKKEHLKLRTWTILHIACSTFSDKFQNLVWKMQNFYIHALFW